MRKNRSQENDTRYSNQEIYLHSTETLYSHLNIDSMIDKYSETLPILQKYSAADKGTALNIELEYQFNAVKHTKEQTFKSLSCDIDLSLMERDLSLLLGGRQSYTTSDRARVIFWSINEWNETGISTPPSNEERVGFNIFSGIVGYCAEKSVRFCNNFLNFSMLVMGIISGLSLTISSTALEEAISPTVSEETISSTVPEETIKNSNAYRSISACFFVLSLAYLLPYALSKTQKKLTALFDRAENRLEENSDTISAEAIEGELKQIGIVHKLILDHHSVLLIRYHYLEGVVNERLEKYHAAKKAYHAALVAPNREKYEFKILRNLVNVYSKLQKSAPPSYEKDILTLVSRSAKLIGYKEALDAVKDSIHIFVNILKSQDLSSAEKSFSDIPWDAYSENAYPNIATVYYQLKAVITLCNQNNNIDALDPESRFLQAKSYLEKSDVCYLNFCDIQKPKQCLSY